MAGFRTRVLASIKHAAVDKSLTDLLDLQIRKCAAGRAPPDYL